MNSKDIKIYNLPKNRQVLYQLEVKPYLILSMIMLIGFIIIIFNATIGLILISISLYAILFLPSRTLLEFTNQYMVMHNKASHTDCVMIYYEDIVTWHYQLGYKYDILTIDLIDGTQEKIECFSKSYVVRCMNSFVMDKQVIKKRNNV